MKNPLESISGTIISGIVITIGILLLLIVFGGSSY